jgi:hypothetical protein
MSQYVHPEFGFFCPSPRVRWWLRAAVAAVVLPAIGLAIIASGRDSESDSAIAVATAEMSAEAQPALEANFTPVAIGGALGAAAGGARTAAEKPSCVGDPASADGRCAVEKPRKPRMVRVPTNRPGIASVILGRTSGPVITANEASAYASSAPASRQAEASKTAQATTGDSAAAGSTEQARPAAKKKTAHTNRRRDQYREVRMADWWSRGYGGGYGYYSRGGYGRSYW